MYTQTDHQMFYLYIYFLLCNHVQHMTPLEPETSKYQTKYKRLRLERLTPLSTILQLYRGRQFYCWKKTAYQEKCINSKFRYITIFLQNMYPIMVKITGTYSIV